MKLRPDQLIGARLFRGRSARTGETFMSGRMGGLRVRVINNPNLDDRGPSGARARYLLVVEPWVGDADFRHEDG